MAQFPCPRLCLAPRNFEHYRSGMGSYAGGLVCESLCVRPRVCMCEYPSYDYCLKGRARKTLRSTKFPWCLGFASCECGCVCVFAECWVWIED